MENVIRMPPFLVDRYIKIVIGTREVSSNSPYRALPRVEEYKNRLTGGFYIVRVSLLKAEQMQ